MIRVLERLTVVEVADGKQTFMTYRTAALFGAAGVLSKAELSLTGRLSTPPFTIAGDPDLEVLRAVDLELAVLA